MSQAETSHEGLIAETNIREYFRNTVSAALSNQRVEADENTVFYVVNLLAYFSRAEHLFEHTPDGYTLQPLALLYERALNAGRPDDRHHSLKRLGDVALLISGLFSDSLNRKAVDVDYYIAMGSSAYGYLSDTSRGSPRARAFQGIFAELSAKFQRFVDVLSEVGENSRLATSGDLLRLYELWVRTGSRRAADKLRKVGVEPMAGSISRRQN
jgi:hypothetical protein